MTLKHTTLIRPRLSARTSTNQGPKMQTMIHQTLRTNLHKRINNEKARTITTLFRYNEMRECEDIHLIQIWIALEDLASHITSFPISYQLQN